MTTSLKQMMEAANAAMPKITTVQAREMIAKGNVLVVDVRDAPEIETSGRSPAPSLFRAGCWNSVLIPSRLITIRISTRVRLSSSIAHPEGARR
jgi:rhodanese-related sulfurtransferase